MDYLKANSFLRELCNKLANEGYQENQICYIILGQQSLQQYKNFVSDDNSNLGIKPLNRALHTLGYKLMLVPIKEEDVNGDEFDSYWETFGKDAEKDIINCIEERSTSSIKRKKRSSKTDTDILNFVGSTPDILSEEVINE